MAAARARAVAGKLVDAFVDRRFERAAATPFLALNEWRMKWATRSEDGAHAARVTSALTQTQDPWNKTEFVEHCTAAYEALLDGISSGNEQKLRDVCSDALFPWVRRGMRDSVAEHGARQGARVLRWLEPARIVQWRAVYASGGASSFFDQPTFGQVTVRFCTLQAPTAHGGGGGGPAARGQARGRPGSGDAASGDQAGAAMPTAIAGTWVPVRDGGSGFTYWFNEATGAVSGRGRARCGVPGVGVGWVAWLCHRAFSSKPPQCQWEQPPPSQLIQRSPFRIETAGCDREAVAGPEGQQPAVRVVHNAVLERAIARGVKGVSAWRFVRL